jgi:hypothetical protein
VNVTLNIDKAGLDKALSQIQNYAWLFEWGMFIFLMVALAATAWVFIDSAQRRKGARALTPRILGIVGILLVIPAFLFRYTGNADGVNRVVWVNAPGTNAQTQKITDPISWNVHWLANGYGSTFALLAMLGTAIAILAAIIYASTANRQEIRSAQGRPVSGATPTSGPAAAPAQPVRGAATVMGPQPGRSAPTVIGGEAQGSFAELRVVSGVSVGQRWQLPTVDVKIGRETTNLVSIDDERASREHAKIRYIDGGYTIIDLGSANGTLVNEQVVQQPVRLNNGDLIKIGNTVLAFQSTG